MHLQRVEDNQKGNPLLKPDVNIDLPMSEQDRKNLEFIDAFGNPHKGYKWTKINNVPVVVPEEFKEPEPEND